MRSTFSRTIFGSMILWSIVAALFFYIISWLLEPSAEVDAQESSLLRLKNQSVLQVFPVPGGCLYAYSSYKTGAALEFAPGQKCYGHEDR